jgi:hypothetical protein
MRVRGTAWLAFMTIAGTLSAGVTVYGTASAIGIDFRQNPVPTSLYCLLPFIAFPVFILVKSARTSAALLATFACGYLVVYSALSWRTCSELGYCSNIAETVLKIFKTGTVLAYFAAALLRTVALFIDNESSNKFRQRSPREAD